MILAADVAGYSRLVAADEEEAIRALRARRRVLDAAIARHGGRIANTAGDSVIAAFSSAVAAVMAALEAQDAIAALNQGLEADRTMTFRIGVNLGEVVAEGRDLLGDGVNIAARIQQEAPPGAVWLSAKVHDEVRGRIAATLTAIGERRMKNLPVPIALFEATLGTRRPPAAVPTGTNGRRLAVGLALLAVAALGGGAALVAPRWLAPREPVAAIVAAPASRPTLVVFPFANLSGDATQDYFSDGVTEEVIAALGRFRSFAVLARSAVLPLSGRALPPIEIGRRLGARYVVEGSLRRGGDRVRATARLSDSADGRVLWSTQLDEPLADLFAVQDLIARQVAGTLATGVARLEQQRALARPTESLDAQDSVLRARAELDRQTRAGNREARRLFERAIALDPRYAAALAGLARALHQQAAFGWTEFQAEALTRAEALAHQALAIDAESVEALNALAAIHTRTGRHDRAREASERAVALNPSDAAAWHALGESQTWAGAVAEAVASFEAALRLNPAPPPEFFLAHGFALYQLRRHDEAIRVLERGLSLSPDYGSLHALLAASYAQARRQDEALQQAQRVRRLMPGFDPQLFGTRFRDPQHHAYVVEGLAQAGLR